MSLKNKVLMSQFLGDTIYLGPKCYASLKTQFDLIAQPNDGDCECTEIREKLYKPTPCDNCKGEEGCPMHLKYVKVMPLDFIKMEVVVKESLLKENPIHNWEHILRVRKLALKFARTCGANLILTEIVTLLYQVQNMKLSSDESVLRILPQVAHNSVGQPTALTQTEQLVLNCVSDADKLESLGAVGIARLFMYADVLKATIYSPDHNMLNHFLEVLLPLENLMKTKQGQLEARERIEWMYDYWMKLCDEVEIEFPLDQLHIFKVEIQSDIITVRTSPVRIREDFQQIIEKALGKCELVTFNRSKFSLFRIHIKTELNKAEIRKIILQLIEE